MTHIHINRNKLNSNRKHNKNDPVITVKSGKTNRYGKIVQILDKYGNIIAEVVQADKRLGIKKLSCGAVSYIRTNNRVRIKK